MIWNCLRFFFKQVAHKDFQYFLFKMRKILLITSHKRQEKVPRCKAIEQTHASPPVEHTFLILRFEKRFCQKRMVKSRNSRLLALSLQEVQLLKETKHPVNIMVSRVVIRDGNITLTFIFSHGLR